MILPRIKNSRVSSALPPLLPATASVVGYERRGREKKKGKEEEKRRPKEEGGIKCSSAQIYWREASSQ